MRPHRVHPWVLLVVALVIGCSAPALPPPAPPVVLEPLTAEDPPVEEPAEPRRGQWIAMDCKELEDDFSRELAFDFEGGVGYGDRTASAPPFELSVVRDDHDSVEVVWRKCAQDEESSTGCSPGHRVLTYLFQRPSLRMTKILWNDKGSGRREDGELVSKTEFQCETIPSEQSPFFRRLRELELVDSPTIDRRGQ